MFPQGARSRHCSQPLPTVQDAGRALTTGPSSQSAGAADANVPKVKTTDDLIATLTRLAISHDRQLQTLEDRHTVIKLIFGQEEKVKVTGIRDKWQKQKARKRQCTHLRRFAKKCGVGTGNDHSAGTGSRLDHESSHRWHSCSQTRRTSSETRHAGLRYRVLASTKTPKSC